MHDVFSPVPFIVILVPPARLPLVGDRLFTSIKIIIEKTV